jgi:drug/metabolite transporter (DMT)-like permease
LVKAIPILFAILGMTAFLHSLRWAQHRRAHIYAVAASNYLTAAVIFVWWIVFTHVPVHNDVLFRGGMIGLLYGTSFFLLMYGIESVGVGKTSIIVNLAQAIPVLASIVIWSERPGWLLIAGICLAAIAIPLIFLPSVSANNRRTRGKVVLAMTVLYIAQGTAYTIMKSFERLGRPDEKPVLLAGLFIMAAILTATIVILLHAKADGSDLFHGIVIGGCNVVSNAALVAALAVAAGTVVFPTVTAGTIIAVTLSSVLIWRERYRATAWLGLLLAVIAVILINL